MKQIEIKNLSKVIRKNTVLEDISLIFEAGRIYGLQGINGSGKTMLMRSMIGLIRPTEGSIKINGKVLGKDIEFPDSIGFLLESPTFLNRYSGFDNLKLLAQINKKITKEQIQDAITMVGLDAEDRKKYKKYSLGMKQRLGIAAAVMEEPEIVIFDEPTNALDASGVEVVKKIIVAQKERGAYVIISCHDLSVLKELSDEIIQLEAGKIVDHILVNK